MKHLKSFMWAGDKCSQASPRFAVVFTAACFGLLSGSAIAQTVNFVGANAGNTGATIPNSNFAGPSTQLANGAENGPATGAITVGGPWTGFQTNRSVTVDEMLPVYSGYAYSRTSFAAGAGGHINPANVHSFNLHTEVANWDICCGLKSESLGSAVFRFNVQDAPPPVFNGATGRWDYTPIPIYYVYEWTAEAIAGDHAWNSGTSYRLQGAFAPDRGGDYWWTDPVLPYDGINLTGAFAGKRSGVFYTYTGGDYTFQFGLQMGAGGIWTRPSSMDMNIRLAFSDTPFTSIPSVSAVPEPETYAMLLAGLGLLGFTARRRKQAV